MPQSMVCRSFAEVAAALGYAESTLAPPGRPDGVPADVGDVDLPDLLVVLEAAGSSLATARLRDDRARERALEALGVHDRLSIALADAEAALARARALRAAGEALAAEAFDEDAGADAGRVAGEARGAETAAARLVDARRAALVAFAAEHDLERLLAERRRREEAELVRAAAADRAARLADAVTGAGRALAAGQLDEAERLLGPAANENPDDPEVASLRQMIARERLERKVADAADALRLARRERKRDPEAAAARLAGLDVEELPSPLAEHVFGCWVDACRRLCRQRGLPDPVRFAPRLGHGAILARAAPAGSLVVVSALGMGPRWQPGSVAPESVLRRVRAVG